jgi:MFS family permease
MVLFSVFIAGYILSQFFRSFLAVIAPELALELHLDPQALATMQTAWILGFTVMQFPVGWALDTIGPRKTVTTTMLAAIIGAVLFARATTAFELDIALSLIGIGCSAIYMGAIFVLGRIYSAKRFALLCSWLIGLGSAGNLLAASPLAWAATEIGWRNAMLLIAVATLLATVLLYWILRDPDPASDTKQMGFWQGLWNIMTLKALWPILPLTSVGYAMLIAERGLWAGPYLSDVHGLGPVDRGNGLLVMAAAMSVGAMIYGPLDHWLGTNKWIVAVGTAVTAASFLYLGLGAPDTTHAILALSILGASGMTYGVLMAHGRSFVPDRLLGRGITLMNMLFIGGAGIVQPISGALMNRMKDHPVAEGYATLHIAFGVALLVTLAVYVFSRDVERIHP